MRLKQGRANKRDDRDVGGSTTQRKVERKNEGEAIGEAGLSGWGAP